MKKLDRTRLILFIIIGFSITNIAVAQQPAWLDYNQRQLLYPESEFLVGFVSGDNTEKEDPGRLMDSYEIFAREQVVQSIIVSIETNQALYTSDVNGKFNEEFLSKTVSISKATINGLRSDRYYDKKKKRVYGLAYVNKKELVFYYQNLVTAHLTELMQKLAEGRDFINMGDKENALRSFYEGMPLLSQIEEAQMLLIALNKMSLVEKDMDEVMNLRIELNREINVLQQSKELNMSESAYFVAYGLYIQLKQIDGWISMAPFTYENTELSSQFTAKWHDDLADALVEAGNFKIKDLSSSTDQHYEVRGNYWQEGEELRIHARVTKNGELLAVSEGSIPKAWLEAEKIDFVPIQIKKIALLDDIELKAINAHQTEKRGKASSVPLEVQVLISQNGELKPFPNVPVIFVSKQNGNILCKGNSNENGVAQGFLPGLQSNATLVEIDARIDISAFADLDTNTALYALVEQQNKVLPAAFQINLERQFFYVESEELLGRSPMEINTIEPVIKQYFAGKGYHFTDIPADADYTIRIEASTTTGNIYQGIYFSFVDANLSIVDHSTGKEVFKTHIDQVKGGGSDFTKAGKKAYVSAAARLKEKIQASGFE